MKLDQDLAAFDALTDLAEFKTPAIRRTDEEIAHRRDLLKLLFTVFGSSLSNNQKLDVLHELSSADDRNDPKAAAARLAALVDPWRHKDTVLGPGLFYLLASDMYVGLAQRLAGIRSGAIADQPAEAHA